MLKRKYFYHHHAEEVIWAMFFFSCINKVYTDIIGRSDQIRTYSRLFFLCLTALDAAAAAADGSGRV